MKRNLSSQSYHTVVLRVPRVMHGFLLSSHGSARTTYTRSYQHIHFGILKLLRCSLPTPSLICQMYTFSLRGPASCSTLSLLEQVNAADSKVSASYSLSGFSKVRQRGYPGCMDGGCQCYAGLWLASMVGVAMGDLAVGLGTCMIYSSDSCFVRSSNAGGCLHAHVLCKSAHLPSNEIQHTAKFYVGGSMHSCALCSTPYPITLLRVSRRRDSSLVSALIVKQLTLIRDCLFTLVLNKR